MIPMSILKRRVQMRVTIQMITSFLLSFHSLMGSKMSTIVIDATMIIDDKITFGMNASIDVNNVQITITTPTLISVDNVDFAPDIAFTFLNKK